MKKNFDIDFDWNKEVTFSCDNCEENLRSDQLSRLKYAEYLYYYLKEQGQEKNTVINLNAEWGAGKTFFVKRLYNSLKNKHPCIYIDAWKQDFSDDAFLTLFASLINQIQKYIGDVDLNLQKIGGSIGRFTKNIIPEIVSGLLKEYAGLESLGEISKKAGELMLKEHEEKSKGMQLLRKELSFWSEESFKKGYEAPVFIFIDELDRCRPNYAVSFLEIVKHFFDIEKFVFVIATDTNQLQHSIKSLYGNDFAANDYLGRFFHRRFTLRAPDVGLLIDDKISNSGLSSNFNKLDMLYPHPSNIDQFIKNISSIFNAFDLNIRDVLRNVDRILDLINSGRFKKKIDYIALLIMMVIYDKDHLIIDSMTSKHLSGVPIKDMVSKSQALKGFGLRSMVLSLDSTLSNTKLKYYYTNNYTQFYNNVFGIEDITVTTVGYFDQFHTFMTEIKNRNRTTIPDKDNRNLVIPADPSGLEKIKLHRGALLTEDSMEGIYRLSDYVDFIEMATTFE